MSSLADEVLSAHGGIERWNRFNQVTATIVTGGGLWAITDQSQNKATKIEQMGSTVVS